MKKKPTEPNESSSQPEYTFEEAMQKIANTPKKLVDELAKSAKTKHKSKVKR